VRTPPEIQLVSLKVEKGCVSEAHCSDGLGQDSLRRHPSHGRRPTMLVDDRLFIVSLTMIPFLIGFFPTSTNHHDPRLLTAIRWDIRPLKGNQTSRNASFSSPTRSSWCQHRYGCSHSHCDQQMSTEVHHASSWSRSSDLWRRGDLVLRWRHHRVWFYIYILSFLLMDLLLPGVQVGL
jgi:hypothetical protein